MNRKQRIVASTLVIAKNLILAYGAGYTFGKAYKEKLRVMKMVGVFAAVNATLGNYLAGREIGKVLEEAAEEKTKE